MTVMGVEPIRSNPGCVQVRAALPLLETHLEQIGEVALERDLEQQRKRRTPIGVQDEILVQPVKAEQPVDRHGHPRSTHVSRWAGEVVGDQMPSRVSVREANRCDRLRAAAIETQLVPRNKARVGRVQPALAGL